MSAYDPPKEDEQIFNPSNWLPSTDEEGITQAQADTRYLIKISPDTATAQETFANSIKTNSIESLTGSNSNIILNANNNLFLNTNSNNAIQIDNVGNVIIKGSSQDLIFDKSTNTLNIPNANIANIRADATPISVNGTYYPLMSNSTDGVGPLLTESNLTWIRAGVPTLRVNGVIESVANALLGNGNDLSQIRNNLFIENSLKIGGTIQENQQPTGNTAATKNSVLECAGNVFCGGILYSNSSIEANSNIQSKTFIQSNYGLRSGQTGSNTTVGTLMLANNNQRSYVLNAANLSGLVIGGPVTTRFAFSANLSANANTTVFTLNHALASSNEQTFLIYLNGLISANSGAANVVARGYNVKFIGQRINGSSSNFTISLMGAEAINNASNSSNLQCGPSNWFFTGQTGSNTPFILEQIMNTNPIGCNLNIRGTCDVTTLESDYSSSFLTAITL